MIKLEKSNNMRRFTFRPHLVHKSLDKDRRCVRLVNLKVAVEDATFHGCSVAVATKTFVAGECILWKKNQLNYKSRNYTFMCCNPLRFKLLNWLRNIGSNQGFVTNEMQLYGKRTNVQIWCSGMISALEMKFYLKVSHCRVLMDHLFEAGLLSPNGCHSGNVIRFL